MPHVFHIGAVSAPDAGPDVGAQTSMTLARLDERLRAHKSSLADTAAITVYLRRPSDFAAMNEAYRQAWQSLPPTRTTVVSELLPTGALVEISAVAVGAGDERRLVHPVSWATSPNPYSYGLRSGDTLFLSGLISRNGRDNSVVNGDVAAQTTVVLDNARELLDAAGLSLAHVVSARVFLPDLSDFDAMNRVYRQYFPDAPPARATVGAALTGSAYKVEMTFIASTGHRRVVQGDASVNPNLSAAIVAGSTTYVSGLLADATVVAAGDAGEQTRDIIRQLDGLLGHAGAARTDVRDLLVYVTDEDAGRAAAAECLAAFGAKPAVTTVQVALAMPRARVEIMTIATKS
jgi:reactive intermediate/imine deaminase